MTPTLDTERRDAEVRPTVEIDPNGTWRQHRFEFCNALEAAVDVTLSKDSRAAAWDALAMYGIRPASDYVPTIIRNETEASAEFVTEDVATITDPMIAANVEVIRRMGGDREIIGYRIYDLIHAEEDANGEPHSSVLPVGKDTR